MAKARRNCLLCAWTIVTLGEIRCQKRRCAVDQHEAIGCTTYKADHTGAGPWSVVMPQTLVKRSRYGSVTVRI
jgi:hypothetical protein